MRYCPVPRQSSGLLLILCGARAGLSKELLSELFTADVALLGSLTGTSGGSVVLATTRKCLNADTEPQLNALLAQCLLSHLNVLVAGSSSMAAWAGASSEGA